MIELKLNYVENLSELLNFVNPSLNKFIEKEDIKKALINIKLSQSFKGDSNIISEDIIENIKENQLSCFILILVYILAKLYNNPKFILNINLSEINIINELNPNLIHKILNDENIEKERQNSFNFIYTDKSYNFWFLNNIILRTKNKKKYIERNRDIPILNMIENIIKENTRF